MFCRLCLFETEAMNFLQTLIKAYLIYNILLQINIFIGSDRLSTLKFLRFFLTKMCFSSDSYCV